MYFVDLMDKNSKQYSRIYSNCGILKCLTLIFPFLEVYLNYFNAFSDQGNALDLTYQ